MPGQIREGHTQFPNSPEGGGGSILCLSVGLISSMIYLPENLGSLVLFNIFEDLPKDVILYSEIHTF
jgi:hypothetical protein